MDVSIGNEFKIHGIAGKNTEYIKVVSLPIQELSHFESCSRSWLEIASYPGVSSSIDESSLT